MIASSYILLYRPFNQDDSAKLINYMLGNFINGYLINSWVVLTYFYNYMKLKGHYETVQIQYSKFISSYENDQMHDNLRALAIFFSAICQCFVYRVFQRMIQDLFP